MKVVKSWIVKPCVISFRLPGSTCKALGIDELPKRRSRLAEVRVLREAGFEPEYEFFDEEAAVQVMNTIARATGVPMQMEPQSKLADCKSPDDVRMRLLPDIKFLPMWVPRSDNRIET